MLCVEHTNELQAVNLTMTNHHNNKTKFDSTIFRKNETKASNLLLPRGWCPNQLERTYTHLKGFQFVCFGIQSRLDKRLLTTQYFVELSLEFLFLFLFAQVCSLW